MRLTTPMLFAIGFIAMFLIGGLSGVINSAASSDYQQHDTYFIVAHFHYTLVGGGLYGLLAGITYWFPKLTGKLYNDSVGRMAFWLFFLGFNITFLSMFVSGLLGMPRRIYTYSAAMGWDVTNMLSSLGALTMAFAIGMLVFELFRALRHGKPAPADPWDARTLEWSIPSPPPEYNFAAIPIVEAREDLWDRKMTGRVAKTLPEGPDGIHMPSQSWMPIIAAFGALLGGFGLLYSQPLGLAGMAIMLLAFFAWALEGEAGYHIHPAGEAE